MIRGLGAGFALVLVLPLAACGGGSGGGGSTPTVAALANKIGCAGIDETTTGRELFAAGQASCTALGDTVNIRTFDNNDARDNWLKAAREFGGRFVVADRAVLYGDQSGTADMIKAKVGGTIHT